MNIIYIKKRRQQKEFSAYGGTVKEVSGYRYHTFTQNGTFTVVNPGEVDILVVGGGGGGGWGNMASGGGGGGGVVYQSILVTNGNYTITVGAGGGKATTNTSEGGDGESSSFGNISASGGGGGGSTGTGVRTGKNGASGGGGALNTYNAQNAGGTGTNGQGNDGARSGRGGAGGGGGAGSSGQIGGVGDYGQGGAGGSGIQWLDGEYYGGGGAGCSTWYSDTSRPVPAGGIGGGGNGGKYNGRVSATNGTNGKGGGGGGSSEYTYTSGNGGSGIIVVKYAVTKNLWTPSSISSDLISWWDASDSTTIFDSISGGSTPSDGGEVKRLEDKSSSGFDLFPPTAYDASAYGPLRSVSHKNGLDCLDFNSSVNNRYLWSSTETNATSSSLFTNWTGFTNFATNRSKMTIIAYFPTKANQLIGNVSYQLKDSHSLGTSSTTFSGSTIFGNRNGNTGVITTSNSESSSGGIYVGYFDRNASTDEYVIRFNGSELTTTDLSGYTYDLTWEDGSGSTSRASINKNSPNNCIMGEIIIVHDGTQSTVEKIEGYMAHKWGLLSDLPSSHPYKTQIPEE